jgi:hypothetical protein
MLRTIAIILWLFALAFWIYVGPLDNNPPDLIALPAIAMVVVPGCLAAGLFLFLLSLPRKRP